MKKKPKKIQTTTISKLRLIGLRLNQISWLTSWSINKNSDLESNPNLAIFELGQYRDLL